MKLFISYRRDDVPQLTYEVFKRLCEAYGESEVFLDTGSLMASDDFKRVIEKYILNCNAVLAMMGKSWCSARDSRGIPRLGQRDDSVTWELETALKNRVMVVPVLVDGTPMPKREELPAGLKSLSGCNTFALETGTKLADSILRIRYALDASTVDSNLDRSWDRLESGAVLTVGGGNAEYTLTPRSPFRSGSKHSVISTPLYGGSGVNYSAKLMGYGFAVLPVLSIGDDPLGQEIREELRRISTDANLPQQVNQWLMRSSFLMPNSRTPRSTIVVEPNGRRTILKEYLTAEERGNFLEHVKHSLDDLESRDLMNKVRAVVIGHIEADRMTPKEIEDREKKGRVPNPGPVTAHIIERFDGKAPLFVNFGESQIMRGYSAWEPLLSKLEVFQLNANELIRFSGSERSIEEIMSIDWLKMPSYSVITMDRFGSLCVGSHKRMSELIVAWSSHSHKLKDTTGAGDAFLSGITSAAVENPKQLQQRQGVFQLMSRGRVWAERACLHYGGASETPSREELEIFSHGCDFEDPIALDEHQAKTILRILSTAFIRDTRPPTDRS